VTEVREIARIAHIHASAYDSPRSQAIYETCKWIIGEGQRPLLGKNTEAR
jgi:hypothetical protein